MTITEAKERLREAGIATRIYSATYIEGGILTDAAGPIPHFKHSFAIDCQNDRWRCAFPRGNTDVVRSFTLLEDAVVYVIRTIQADLGRLVGSSTSLT